MACVYGGTHGKFCAKQVVSSFRSSMYGGMEAAACWQQHARPAHSFCLQGRLAPGAAARERTSALSDALPITRSILCAPSVSSHDCRYLQRTRVWLTLRSLALPVGMRKAVKQSIHVHCTWLFVLDFGCCGCHWHAACSGHLLGSALCRPLRPDRVLGTTYFCCKRHCAP